MAKREVADISDAEEEAIQAGIAQDPDNPELTEEEFARMRPAAEVLPPELYAALAKHQSGLDRHDASKRQISVRLDQDVVDAFRAAGPGWQSRINKALRKAVGL